MVQGPKCFKCGKGPDETAQRHINENKGVRGAKWFCTCANWTWVNPRAAPRSGGGSTSESPPARGGGSRRQNPGGGGRPSSDRRPSPAGAPRGGRAAAGGGAGAAGGPPGGTGGAGAGGHGGPDPLIAAIKGLQEEVASLRRAPPRRRTRVRRDATQGDASGEDNSDRERFVRFAGGPAPGPPAEPAESDGDERDAFDTAEDEPMDGKPVTQERLQELTADVERAEALHGSCADEHSAAIVEKTKSLLKAAREAQEAQTPASVKCFRLGRETKKIGGALKRARAEVASLRSALEEDARKLEEQRIKVKESERRLGEAVGKAAELEKKLAAQERKVSVATDKDAQFFAALDVSTDGLGPVGLAQLREKFRALEREAVELVRASGPARGRPPPTERRGAPFSRGERERLRRDLPRRRRFRRPGGRGPRPSGAARRRGRPAHAAVRPPGRSRSGGPGDATGALRRHPGCGGGVPAACGRACRAHSRGRRAPPSGPAGARGAQVQGRAGEVGHIFSGQW